MHIFLGKTIKYLLWFSLFVLLGAFVFGLIEFKGNFLSYISYLNQVNVFDVTTFASSKLPNEASSGSIDEITNSDQILSSGDQDDIVSLDDDYFLPNSGSSLSGEIDKNDDIYGFSGSFVQDSVSQSGITTQNQAVYQSGSAESKEALINLIKSHEK